jgi:arylsulfatase A-like enzyme
MTKKSNLIKYVKFFNDKWMIYLRGGKWYKGYYAATETLDDCLGNILDALEKAGQLDKSIIVFTSDHGDNLGSHRQKGKQLPFEESISVPLLIRYPEKIKFGTTTDALLAPVDIMPTLLSLADVKCPQVDGKDISAAAMGKGSDMQDAVLIMKSIPLSTNWRVNGNDAWRGVRTKRYTYARKSYSKTSWMLFDNLKDPFQMNNLVDNPSYADLRKELDKKTDQLLVLAGDPEDPMVYAKLIQKEKKERGINVKLKTLMPDRVKPKSSLGY